MRVVPRVGCVLAVAAVVLSVLGSGVRAQDTTAPTIYAVVAEPPRLRTGASFSIGAWVTDDTGVASVSANITRPDGSHVNATMQGPPSFLIWAYSSADTGLAGTYGVLVWAVDAAGNAASAPASFEVYAPGSDTTPPVVTDLAANPPVQVFGGAVMVSATIADDTQLLAYPFVIYTLPDGTTAYYGLSYQTQRGNAFWDTEIWFDAGTYAFAFWACDVSGNCALSESTFAIGAATDTIPPTIADAAAHPPSQAAGGSVTIAATVTDATAVGTVTIDVTQPSGAHVTGPMVASGDTYLYTATWAQPGTHTFTISGADLAGNTATATGSFVIRAPDTTPPTVTPTPPSSVYVGDLVPVAATVTDDDRVAQVYVAFTDVNGVAQNVTMTPTTGGTYAYSIPAQGAAGSLRYRIYAVDASGNGALSSEQSVAVMARQAPPPLGSDPVVSGLLVALVVLNVLLLASVALVLRRGRRTEPPPSP